MTTRRRDRPTADGAETEPYSNAHEMMTIPPRDVQPSATPPSQDSKLALCQSCVESAADCGKHRPSCPSCCNSCVSCCCSCGAWLLDHQSACTCCMGTIAVVGVCCPLYYQALSGKDIRIFRSRPSASPVPSVATSATTSGFPTQYTTISATEGQSNRQVLETPERSYTSSLDNKFCVTCRPTETASPNAGS